MTTTMTTNDPIARLTATFDVTVHSSDEFITAYQQAISCELRLQSQKSSVDWILNKFQEMCLGKPQEQLMRWKFAKVVKKMIAENATVQAWERMRSLWLLHCAHFGTHDTGFVNNVIHGVAITSLCPDITASILSYLPVNNRALFTVSKQWQFQWLQAEKRCLGLVQQHSIHNFYSWLIGQLPNHAYARSLALRTFSISPLPTTKLDAKIVRINSKIFAILNQTRRGWFRGSLFDLTQMTAIPRNLYKQPDIGSKLIFESLQLGSNQNPYIAIPSSLQVVFRNCTIDGPFEIYGCEENGGKPDYSKGADVFLVSFENCAFYNLPLIRKAASENSSFYAGAGVGIGANYGKKGRLLYFKECSMHVKGSQSLDKIGNRAHLILEKCKIADPHLIAGIMPQNQLTIDLQSLESYQIEAANRDKSAEVSLVNCEILTFDSP